MPPHNFRPASDGDASVYGASRPGYPATQVAAGPVDEWISFMVQRGIVRVVCLLPESQLAYYAALPQGLLGRCREAFGNENVLHAPIEDYHLSSPEKLSLVMRFLLESHNQGRPTVVHCSGGSGRTGHVLAAWIVYAWDYEPQAAIEAVQKTGRNPCEAVHCGNATEAELIALLNAVRVKTPGKEA